jgi:hypothetical protein
MLTVTSGVAAVASWQTYQEQGAKFLPIRRGSGVTTMDNTAGLGALALLMGLVCAGSGEQNPANFEECWKCQRNRPKRP